VSAENRLVELAAAVGDGVPVDWSRVEYDSDARTAEVIRHLRLVERIASIHTTESLARFSSPALSSGGNAGDSAAAWEPGSTWGSLAVGERIGRGTYGDVYAARDIRLDRPVALKLLHRSEADEGSEEAVIHEAQLLARVRHPNVVTVYGAERIDGRVGIWMELVEGRTLEDELAERGPFPPGEVAAIGAALSSAVAAVHAAGLLHRDIKAHNVMRGRDGRILLADFGTGREVTREGLVGELAGTPLYLAPELLEGEPASVASDVYSLGVLLYHLGTRAYPVCGRSVADLRDAFLTDRRTPLLRCRPDIPKRLARAVERAIDPVPSRRYDSAASLGSALVPTPHRRPRVVWLTVAALLTLTAITGLWRRHGSDPPPPRFVLVGAFDNETGDRRLDDVVQFAFAQELLQSRAVTVAPRERVVDTLRLMKRPAGAPLDASTAHEVATRDGGIQLIATGRIDRLDRTYALRAAITDVSSGALVAQATVEVADIDALLEAVRTLAARIRTAVGDERRQVESDSRLARVTTGSLEALRDYTAGVALIDGRQWAAAELRLMDAVRQDPSFASALIMLAHSRRNQGRAQDDFMPAAEQARRLAESLPARERYFIEGSFHQMNGDLSRAIAAYEVLVRERPDDFWGLNNLSTAYTALGRWREEIPIAKRILLLRRNDRVTLVNAAARLVAAGDGVSDALELASRASTLELPPGTRDRAGPDAWVAFLPAFAAWAEGRVVDAAALLDGFDGVTLGSDGHAFRLGKMNLALGRVRAAERAFQQMSVAPEREALLGYAAFARGDIFGARHILAGAAPALAESATASGPARGVAVCWALLQTGLAGPCGRVNVPLPGAGRPEWHLGALTAAAGDDTAALHELQRLVANVPPGDFRYVLAADAVARLFERRGDLAAAAAALRRLDGVQRAAYAVSGMHGFEWLLARAHLLELERRLGQTDSAHAIARDLERWLSVADPDFVIRASVP
jgi:tetratricopeptide (TPR) repeat protein